MQAETDSVRVKKLAVKRQSICVGTDSHIYRPVNLSLYEEAKP